jgi:hypothetical protein
VKFAFIGLAAGLYPILFYYTYNFSLINSWKHLGFFAGLFLLFPVATFMVLYLFSKRSTKNYPWMSIATFLNAFFFLNFIQLCLFARMQIWITLLVLMASLILGKYTHRFLGKMVLFQFLLAGISLFSFVPRLLSQLNYSSEWMVQPDDIEQVVFKRTPNVYYIQPDGYVNFSEIDRGYYGVDNSSFKSFLEAQGFKNYPDVRSNYTATLESNSATFAMKHHYYNNGFNFSEIVNARETIITKNPVLDIFKNNGYTTYFLPEIPYLITNLPEMGYDVTNFGEKDISLVTQGLQGRKEVMPGVEKALDDTSDAPKFFFIELFSPGHVTSHQNESKGKEVEKEEYLRKLGDANKKMEELISMIRAKDPDGLILIMADHGGYVGFDYMLELQEKQSDRDLIYSAFSAQLSIYWPNKEAPLYDAQLKTTINTFRILFAYLGDHSAYVDHLQEDASYSIILKGATKGIYKYINEQGEVVFEKL